MEKYCVAGRVRPDTIWHMRFACWIIKAADTTSEYVLLIAFAS
jgi:hypothetical protein